MSRLATDADLGTADFPPAHRGQSASQAEQPVLAPARCPGRRLDVEKPHAFQRLASSGIVVLNVDEVARPAEQTEVVALAEPLVDNVSDGGCQRVPRLAQRELVAPGDLHYGGTVVEEGGEVGNTSAGAVVFERGAINIADSSKVKLLLEHDPKQPIGRAQFFNETEDGIFASFKISKSSRGTDALIEASEELRTGLSVGVMVNAAKPKNGVLYVSSADLLEVSLVQAAAFKSAAVTDIAASEDEAVEETLPTESETATVEETTSAVEATPTVSVRLVVTDLCTAHWRAASASPTISEDAR